jgi:hypothetical protein
MSEIDKIPITEGVMGYPDVIISEEHSLQNIKLFRDLPLNILFAKLFSVIILL